MKEQRREPIRQGLLSSMTLPLASKNYGMRGVSVITLGSEEGWGNVTYMTSDETGGRGVHGRWDQKLVRLVGVS